MQRHDPDRTRHGSRRTAIVAGALVLIGLALTVVRIGTVSGGSARSVRQATAPVLSARRVPDALRNATGRRAMRDVVGRILARPELTRARSRSCLVVEAAGGEVYRVGGERAVMPASTLKLLTALSAHSVLDVRSRFRTEVRASSAPVDGVVRGDLWFVGGGDPLLETAAYTATQEHAAAVATPLDALADAVVASGVRAVEGGVVGDDRRYDAQRSVITWKRSYTTEGEVGPISALLVDDSFTDGEGLDRRASSDPPRAAATVLRSLLEDRGVRFGGPDVSARSLGAEVRAPDHAVAHIDSVTVDEVIGQMLQWSDNTTAEMLLKEVGLRRSGIGSTASGIAATRAVLRGLGVPLRGVRTVDGSGLDRSDRVTCDALLGTLRALSPEQTGLPVMGVSGTLRKRLVASTATGRVLAKTGSLNGVSALAGYARSTDGSVLRFASVFNGLLATSDGVAAGDSLAEALVLYPNAPDRSVFSVAAPRDAGSARGSGTTPPGAVATVATIATTSTISPSTTSTGAVSTGAVSTGATSTSAISTSAAATSSSAITTTVSPRATTSAPSTSSRTTAALAPAPTTTPTSASRVTTTRRSGAGPAVPSA